MVGAWSFCAVLYFVSLKDIATGAAAYDIPLDAIYNKFSRSLLEWILVDINGRQEGQYLIFDVPRAQSKLSDAIQYEYELTLAPHNCETQRRAKSVTFADCKSIGRNFQSCKATVKYSPWKDSEHQLILHQLDCEPTTPSLPKNPHVLGYSLPSNADDLFVAFREKHRRYYSTQEAGNRLKIFKRNLLRIQFLQDIDKDAEYGITAFSDVDVDEFKRTHANLKKSDGLMVQMKTIVLDDFSEVPSTFDWRTKGAVTEVKDQGYCGSCWAFGTVGNIETQWFLKNGTLLSLSVQQLLDCDEKDEACNGGLPEWAFPQIIKMGGLMNEKDYPYEARKESSCHLVNKNIAAKIDDWAQLPKNETKLAAWLAQNGTITVGINANFLQFYMGGISHPPHFLCSDEGLDHAVLLVGYGVSSILSRPYWIVKNSWGLGWGESDLRSTDIDAPSNSVRVLRVVDKLWLHPVKRVQFEFHNNYKLKPFRFNGSDHSLPN